MYFDDRKRKSFFTENVAFLLSISFPVFQAKEEAKYSLESEKKRKAQREIPVFSQFLAIQLRVS
jgi:hypothetical protein